MSKRLVVLLPALLLAACASNNVEPPAPLVKFTPALKVERLWDRSIADAPVRLRLGLVPASDGQAVYAAGRDGAVYAFALRNGDHLWTARTDLPLGGGPAVGNGMVIVAATDGSVVALGAANGKPLWHTNVNGEILTAPAVSAEAVVVRTTDGRLIALSPDDGHKLWSVLREEPRLSLRGACPPVIAGNTVFDGLDNGQLLALNLTDGSQRWVTPVATPGGGSELAALVDIDGPLALDGSDVYAVAYQGQIADLSRDGGQVLWSREMSSYTGVSVDSRHVYVSDVHSEVWALDRTSGAPLWTQPAMRARDLTLPVPYRGTVATGDLEGYVHFLSQDDGRIVARVRAGSDPILAPPLAVNGLLVVLTTGGDLAVYRAAPLTGGS